MRLTVGMLEIVNIPFQGFQGSIDRVRTEIKMHINEAVLILARCSPWITLETDPGCKSGISPG